MPEFTTAGVGGTGVIYVLHDATKPEAYGGLPANPHVPGSVKLWKEPAEVDWQPGDHRRNRGVVAHYLRYGPKIVPEDSGKGDQ
jgi:hypothetical protein